MKPTLDELGLKYGTDKSSAFHNYLSVYEPYLDLRRETVARVLEIGVDKGASIQMWRDYFPKAEVVGLDNRPACLNLQLGDRTKVLLADALDSNFMLPFHRQSPFDLVIEDGAHTCPMTVNAFNCGWPYVAPGGLYIVEDLHCAFHPMYCEPGKRGETDGRWALFLEQIQQMSKGEPCLCGNASSNTHSVRFMHFYRSLLIIGKRCSSATRTATGPPNHV